MTDSAAIRQQRLAEEVLTHRSRIFNQVFAGVQGQEVLGIILEDLCRMTKQLPQIDGNHALYWSGRGDVARAIKQIMEFTPRSDPVVVKTRKDGQP